MTPAAELKSLLVNASSGTIDVKQLARLILISRSMAEAFLNHRRSSIVHLCSFHGITVGDLAMDCLAELFARDEGNQFTQIRNFLAALKNPLESVPELDVFLAYKAFLTKIIAAQLARVYAEIDPAGAKIRRNIKDALKHSEGFALKEDFRGYVLAPAVGDPLDHLEDFPLSELEGELTSRASISSEIPDLLKALCAILMQQDRHRRSVPLIDLVQVVKSIFSRFSPFEEREETEIDLSELNAADLFPLRRQVLHGVNEKIISTYLLKRKVNREEALALSRVMHSIITEWFEEGERKNSFYDYVRRFQPVTEEEYNAVWRQRIEYLARVGREIIKSHFDENL